MDNNTLQLHGMRSAAPTVRSTRPQSISGASSTQANSRRATNCPSHEDLCETLGVSMVTLRAAMTSFKSQGLVVVKRGKGGGSWIVDRADSARALG